MSEFGLVRCEAHICECADGVHVVMQDEEDGGYVQAEPALTKLRELWEMVSDMRVFVVGTIARQERELAEQPHQRSTHLHDCLVSNQDFLAEVDALISTRAALTRALATEEK